MFHLEPLTKVKTVLLFLVFFAAMQVLAQNNSQGSETGPSPKVESISITQDKTQTYLMCKNDKVVRTVRIEKRDNGGCKTTYTKDGTDQNVGESWHIPGCIKILKNIQENLEKAGWKCKEIGDSRVSFTEQ